MLFGDLKQGFSGMYGVDIVQLNHLIVPFEFRVCEELLLRRYMYRRGHNRDQLDLSWIVASKEDLVGKARRGGYLANSSRACSPRGLDWVVNSDGPQIALERYCRFPPMEG